MLDFSPSVPKFGMAIALFLGREIKKAKDAGILALCVSVLGSGDGTENLLDIGDLLELAGLLPSSLVQELSVT